MYLFDHFEPESFPIFYAVSFCGSLCFFLFAQAEEEETARALRDFEATFQETAKINRTWVKGGVVNPGSNGLSTLTFSFACYYRE